MTTFLIRTLLDAACTLLHWPWLARRCVAMHAYVIPHTRYVAGPTATDHAQPGWLREYMVPHAPDPILYTDCTRAPGDQDTRTPTAQSHRRPTRTDGTLKSQMGTRHDAVDLATWAGCEH